MILPHFSFLLSCCWRKILVDSCCKSPYEKCLNDIIKMSSVTFLWEAEEKGRDGSWHLFSTKEEKWQFYLQVSERNKDIDTVKEYTLCYTASRQGFVPCTQGWSLPWWSWTWKSLLLLTHQIMWELGIQVDNLMFWTFFFVPTAQRLTAILIRLSLNQIWLLLTFRTLSSSPFPCL